MQNISYFFFVLSLPFWLLYQLEIPCYWTCNENHIAGFPLSFYLLSTLSILYSHYFSLISYFLLFIHLPLCSIISLSFPLSKLLYFYYFSLLPSIFNPSSSVLLSLPPPSFLPSLYPNSSILWCLPLSLFPSLYLSFSIFIIFPPSLPSSLYLSSSVLVISLSFPSFFSLSTLLYFYRFFFPPFFPLSKLLYFHHFSPFPSFLLFIHHHLFFIIFPSSFLWHRHWQTDWLIDWLIDM